MAVIDEWQAGRRACGVRVTHNLHRRKKKVLPAVGTTLSCGNVGVLECGLLSESGFLLEIIWLFSLFMFECLKLSKLEGNLKKCDSIT